MDEAHKSLSKHRYEQALTSLSSANLLIQHGDYEGDELQLPALLITDKDLKVTYVHYGNDITDMPIVDELIEKILWSSR